MVKRGTLTVLLLVLGWWLTPVVVAQDLSAAEMIEGLSGFLKKKNDQTAKGTLELIGQSFDKFDEGDQKKLVKAVEKCLNVRREDGDNGIYIAALETMVMMGPLGQKATTKALKAKNVKGRREVLASAVKCLAAHKDPKSIDAIVKFLVYKEALVVAAAAEGLGENYRAQPEKVRKEIVAELVKNYSTYHSAVAANPREPHYRDRLNIVERPFQMALQGLTGQSIESAVDWQKWYNDNKKKKWGELSET